MDIDLPNLRSVLFQGKNSLTDLEESIKERNYNISKDINIYIMKYHDFESRNRLKKTRRERSMKSRHTPTKPKSGNSIGVS